MKHFLLLLSFSCVFIFGSYAATNKRSDTIKIRKYTIHLNVTDFSTHTISGFTDVDFAAKIGGITQLILDLQNLTVDSVFYNSVLTTSVRQNPYLFVNLPTALAINDSGMVRIYYHGFPFADPTWGGFTYSGNYAFNMGVGFSAMPHNLGRAWFPCVDNFVERSKFETFITTPNNYKAFCDGLLIDTVQETNDVIWHWKMDKPIASYLEGVAVAQYATINNSYPSLGGGNIPVQIGALPGDTALVKTSFNFLQQAFNTFEQKFYPYQWDRVGYVMVPFNAGAMEHASNIAYGRPFLGNIAYESIYPHELSHMWFGDLVTCETAEDMWLNEGWAAYCEKIFYENVYSRQRYISEVTKNHLSVLQQAHLSDSGYFAMSPMPQKITYGATTYDKGADMVHTLRTYMGDAKFFSSLHSYFEYTKWKTANSYQFRDSLAKYSGNTNLTNFFNDWIFQPGFPDIHLVQFRNGNVNITVRKAQNAVHGYTSIPIQLTFFDNNFNQTTVDTFVNEDCNMFSFPAFSNSAFVAVDFNELLSDAVTDDWKIFKTTGAVTFANAKMVVNVSAITDSVLLRIEHHWNRPDAVKNTIAGFHLADRYWKVDGVQLQKLTAKATINYNGTSSGYFIDKEFITNSEDSMTLLYRTDAADDWHIVSAADCIINKQGSATNKIGQITINQLQKGEYTMGIYDAHYIDTSNNAFAVNNCFEANGIETISKENCFEVYPSPSTQEVTVKLNQTITDSATIEVFDVSGKLVKSILVRKTTPVLLEKINLATGTYIISVKNKAMNCEAKKIIIQK